MNIIRNYYTAQDELLQLINKQYEQYLHKKVRLLLSDDSHKTSREYPQVFYEGIYNDNGFLYLKYKCVKKDGTRSKNGGSVILFVFDQLEFHLIDE